MALKKNDPGRQPLEAVDDPAVEAALRRGQEDVYGRIERARKMTPAQRKKVERDARRSKATYDLPSALIEQIETMARDVYHCPASHLAALLIKVGLREVGQARLNVFDFRKVANSPRFEYFLDLDRFDENVWQPKK